MKKFLFVTLGLIGLLGLSSCDDKSTYQENEEFLPIGFLVKDATTIQIIGPRNLVIDELEKTDWALYVQNYRAFAGQEPLELKETEVDLYLFNKREIEVETNYDDLSVAVGALKYPYTYLGEQQMLECFSPLKIKMEIVSEEMQSSPFFQKGNVKFILVSRSIDTEEEIILVEKKLGFEVASEEYIEKKLNTEEYEK
ncbi:MAG: hypothetical protein IJ532_03685 [Alphaproteobacteria bacterium]|nr:hypothetical protein [Alphaproteobacteria bacterium]